MRLLIAAAFLLAGLSPASAVCYWQAPVADNAAYPPPYFTQRCDLGVLPMVNDPATIDQVEVINPGTNPQKYLHEEAQVFAPDPNGMAQLLSYIIPFAPKRSTNLKLIAESQALAFHFYSPAGAPYCIGTVAPICYSYTTANPYWAGYARLWVTGHWSYDNFSMVLQLPPNQLPIGAWVKLLIDGDDNAANKKLWVIAE
jgi:hypothetical protein